MLSLYETGDGWTEDTLTWNNKPAVGALIETHAAPTAGGQTVVFNSTALVNYVDGQAAGDNVASFALRFSSGCSAGVSLVIFEDEESQSNEPDLQLLDPTAVQLHSLQTVGSGASWGTALAFTISVVGLASLGWLIVQRIRLRQG